MKNKILCVYSHLFRKLFVFKPNSHQTIFTTDFHQWPPIQESVGVGQFFLVKIGWCDMEIGGARHQRFLLVKVGRFSH